MRAGHFITSVAIGALLAFPAFAQSINNSMSMANPSGQTPAVQSPAQGAAATVPVNQTPTQAAPLPQAEKFGPLTQPQSYIWFGDDQINDAAGLIKNGRYIEALSVLDKVIQRDVRLSEAHMLQGVAYIQLKDFAKAKLAFNTVVTIDRAYSGAYIYMADIAVQEKDPGQAKVYLQAIKAICQTTECAEYQYLKNALRTRGIEVSD